MGLNGYSRFYRRKHPYTTFKHCLILRMSIFTTRADLLLYQTPPHTPFHRMLHHLLPLSPLRLQRCKLTLWPYRSPSGCVALNGEISFTC